MDERREVGGADRMRGSAGAGVPDVEMGTVWVRGAGEGAGEGEALHPGRRGQTRPSGLRGSRGPANQMRARTFTDGGDGGGFVALMPMSVWLRSQNGGARNMESGGRACQADASGG